MLKNTFCHQPVFLLGTAASADDGVWYVGVRAVEQQTATGPKIAIDGELDNGL